MEPSLVSPSLSYIQSSILLSPETRKAQLSSPILGSHHVGEGNIRRVDLPHNDELGIFRVDQGTGIPADRPQAVDGSRHSIPLGIQLVVDLQHSRHPVESKATGDDVGAGDVADPFLVKAGMPGRDGSIEKGVIPGHVGAHLGLGDPFGRISAALGWKGGVSVPYLTVMFGEELVVLTEHHVVLSIIDLVGVGYVCVS